MRDAIERRLKALETENRDLKVRLDALQVQTPAKVMPLPPSPVKMSRLVSKVTLPTQDEYPRLLRVVLDHHPILRPRADTPDYFAQFKSAFIRLSHCGRRDKIDNQRGLGFWVDDASDWCCRHNVNPPWISGGAFTAAVIACGDVEFVIEDWPHDFVCSLMFGGGGRDAKDWWRRALAGTLLDPTPPLHRAPLPAPSRITRSAM